MHDRPLARLALLLLPRAEVGARRMGLQLFTLRSVVTAPRREAQDER